MDHADNESLGSFTAEADTRDDGPRGFHRQARASASSTPTPATASSNSNKTKQRRSSKAKPITDIGTQLLADSASASQALIRVKKEELAQLKEIEEQRLKVEERKQAAAEKEGRVKALVDMRKAFPEMSIEEIKQLLKDMDE
jgi:uncharacterized membrane protein YccC